MRACPSCGSPALPADAYCGSCGTRLAAAGGSCPRCGRDVEPEDRHCRHCGLPLQTASDHTGETPRVGAAAGGAPDPTDTQVFPASEPYLSPRAEPWVREAEEQGSEPGEAPRRRGEPPVGAILAFVAALMVVASGFLPWRAPALGGGTGADVPLRFLLDPEARARQGELTIAFVLLGLGTAGALASLLTMVVPWLRFLRRLVGTLTFLVPLVFVVRSELELRFLGGEHAFLESIGSGVWVCAGAAIVEIVAGRWFGR